MIADFGLPISDFLYTEIGIDNFKKPEISNLQFMAKK